MAHARKTLYNAVVARELRTRVRGWRPLAVITACMGVLGAVAAGFLLEQAGATVGQPSSAGVQLFQVLGACQFALILFITPASIAGAICGERQHRTWDLLLITRLTTLGIVWGKLVAGLAFNVLLIVAPLPLYGLACFFGGVAPDYIIRLYLVFLATVLLLGTVSLLVSALTRRIAGAMIASNMIALVLAAGITLLAASLENWGTLQYATPGLEGPQVSALPALTPLAQLDPIVALASALPGTGGSSFLGGLSTVRHAFGSSLTLEIWSVYSIIAVAASALMVALTVLAVRYPPHWLTRDAA
jgi:ABC-type transport system involved in multi-copper enzyme maturation permease subunit